MDSQMTMLKLRGWSGLTNNYVKTGVRQMQTAILQTRTWVSQTRTSVSQNSTLVRLFRLAVSVGKGNTIYNLPVCESAVCICRAPR